MSPRDWELELKKYVAHFFLQLHIEDTCVFIDNSNLLIFLPPIGYLIKYLEYLALYLL